MRPSCTDSDTDPKLRAGTQQVPSELGAVQTQGEKVARVPAMEEGLCTPSRPEDVQQRRVEDMKALGAVNAGKLTQETEEKSAPVPKVKY